MQNTLETLMYQAGQLFLLPALLLIAAMFIYAFWLLGHFAAQYWRRRQGGGRPLVVRYQARPELSENDLDLYAHQLLETPRIASRVAPMMGLVATMIPMGPALKGLSDGDLASVSNNLTIAFSAVILALIAASISFWVVNVKRRWLAEEMLEVEAVRTAAKKEAPR